MSQLKALLTIACSISLFACGGSTVEESEINKGWRATRAVLTSAGATSGQALTSSDASAELEHSCPGGGTATFVAATDMSSDDEGANANFSYSVTFAECVSHGVQIDGSLDYTGAATASAGSASYTFSYDGEVAWAGEANGDCVIDMTGSTSATVTGMSFSASLNYEGSVCGEDASAALSVSF